MLANFIFNLCIRFLKLLICCVGLYVSSAPHDYFVCLQYELHSGFDSLKLIWSWLENVISQAEILFAPTRSMSCKQVKQVIIQVVVGCFGTDLLNIQVRTISICLDSTPFTSQLVGFNWPSSFFVFTPLIYG